MAFIADAYDTDKIQKGRWFDYQGSRFLIARSDNDAFRKASGEAERERLMAKPEDRKFGPDLHDENLRIAAEHLLLDWEGVQTREGGEVDYTAERGFLAMRNDTAFADFVVASARDHAAYRYDSLKETAKKP